MFPRPSSEDRMVEPFMEAAGIEPAQDASGKRGWVYLISDGGWSYKIGFARDPVKRLALLQTGSPEPLRLVAVIDGPQSLEREVHELFAGTRVRGEWFLESKELKWFFEDRGFVCTCTRRAVDADCFIHGEGHAPW